MYKTLKKMSVFDHNSLKKWFLQTKRDLPWRKNLTPYRVWISEVMLQQTRAEVVIPYFNRWMKRFPDIESLAKSSLEEVIKCWEGLGYYSRAKNLHAGAKQILDLYQGNIPDNENHLLPIKGLGPYTTNAILSFAFHKKAFPLDGNAIRVLTRFFANGKDVSKPLTIKGLRVVGQNLLPETDHWIISEAMIELGAVICTKKPLCSSCPLKENCASYKLGAALQFPYKSKKVKITEIKRAIAVFVQGNKVLLKKEEEGKIMAGLYEFPYFEIDQIIFENELREKIHRLLPFAIQKITALPKQTQAFTRFRAELYPFLCETAYSADFGGYKWFTKEQLKDIALSSGHRRILASLIGLI